MAIWEEERERRTKGESKAVDIYIGEIACTYVMQRAQLAILYVLDSLHTYNGHLGRERGGERKGKARLLILYR